MITVDERRARIEQQAHEASRQMEGLTAEQVRTVLYALSRAGYTVAHEEGGVMARKHKETSE